MYLLLFYSKRPELIVVLRTNCGGLGPSYRRCATFTSWSISVRKLRDCVDTFFTKPSSLLLAESSNKAQIIGFNGDPVASGLKLAKDPVVV